MLFRSALSHLSVALIPHPPPVSQSGVSNFESKIRRGSRTTKATPTYVTRIYNTVFCIIHPIVYWPTYSRANGTAKKEGN